MLERKLNDKVVIVCTDSNTSRMLYHALCLDHNVDKVVFEDKISILKRVKSRYNKLGIMKVIGQLLFQIVVHPILEYSSKKRLAEIIEKNKLNINPIATDKILRVKSINSNESRLILEELNPALIIVNGTRIINTKTLNCVPIPFINTHVGITPRYRGVHGGYWSMVDNGGKYFGVTVHLVDKGVDTGSILGQTIFQPSSSDSFVTYPYLQMIYALKIHKKIIPEILNQNYSVLTSLCELESKQWYHPTFLEYMLNRIFKGVK